MRIYTSDRIDTFFRSPGKDVCNNKKKKTYLSRCKPTISFFGFDCGNCN